MKYVSVVLKVNSDWNDGWDTRLYKNELVTRWFHDDQMSGSHIYKERPVLRRDRAQNIYMKTIKMVRTVRVFSGPFLTSPSAAQGLDISLFLQPRRWPDWSLLPHSLPQTLSSPESSLSSWQWVIVMSATENNKMQSHCDHRGTLDHWTPALWLLYIRQQTRCSMKHSTTVRVWFLFLCV